MITLSKLLENIPEEGSLEIKKLERILKLTRKIEKDKLIIAINALNKLGIIQSDESGLIKLKRNENLVEARLRCSTKGYCFAVRNDNSEDIYIRDQYLNNAWHGDNIFLKITKEGVRRRSPEGEIQCILERNTKTLVCLIDQQDGDLIAIPLEERILANINLSQKDNIYHTNNILDNIVEVQVDKYPIGQYLAEGHVIKKLSLNDCPEGDKEFLLAKVGINSDSTQPRGALKKPSDKNRIDLTNQPALLLTSWENKNSPLLPAFFVEAREGGVRIWLHIPTVAERIGLGSNLDLWLREKGESFCLGNSWNPLLSDALNKTSKFTVNEENHSISLIIDIDPNGIVKDWNFKLTKIKPHIEINSDILKTLNSRKSKSRTLPIKLKPIKDYINQLETLIFASKLIEKKQNELGLIELDLELPKIDYLSELIKCNPGDNYNQWYRPINNNDPQSVISPIIHLANKIYLEHVKSLQLPAYIITSTNIDSNTLNDLAKIALALDLELELDEDGVPTAKELSISFSKNSCRRVLDKLLKNYLPKKVLNIYDSNNTHESSTNLDCSPWCSPGSHYYDIANQYVLTTLLNEAKNKESGRNKRILDLGQKDSYKDLNWELFPENIRKSLVSITNKNLYLHLTKRRRQAINLKSQIFAMAKSRSAEDLVGREIEAIISGVQSYGFFAELPPHLSEGLVHVSSLNDDWYEYRSRQNRLVGRKSKQSYQLGDHVLVKVIKVDILKNQIDLEVVKNEKGLELKTEKVEVKDQILIKEKI